MPSPLISDPLTQPLPLAAKYIVRKGVDQWGVLLPFALSLDDLYLFPTWLGAIQFVEYVRVYGEAVFEA